MRKEIDLNNLKKQVAYEYDELTRFYFREYINPTLLTDKELDKTQLVRLEVANKFLTLERQGKVLYHLVTTYIPNSDKDYDQKIVDDFFKNFYTKRFLPYLLQSRNIGTNSNKKIQPITYTFIENHKQKSRAIRSIGCPINGDLVVNDFPVKLHHHSVLAIDKVHVERLDKFLGENTFANDSFSKKIMTSCLTKCSAEVVLYANKYLKVGDEFMTFPDKLHTEKENIGRPNKWRMNHPFEKNRLFPNRSHKLKERYMQTHQRSEVVTDLPM